MLEQRTPRRHTHFENTAPRMPKLFPPTITTPCPKLWQEMHGDSKTRFCDHCHLHVQNLSAMSQGDVARALARAETERVCVTYTRLQDGSLVTRWEAFCDSLLGPLRRGLTYALTALAPILLGACQAQNKTQSSLTGRPLPACKSQEQKKTAQETERVIVTGGVFIPN
jgi:hypothetical protein